MAVRFSRREMPPVWRQLRPNEADANDRAQVEQQARQEAANSTKTTVTTTTTVETKTLKSFAPQSDGRLSSYTGSGGEDRLSTTLREPLESVAIVEDLGRQAASVNTSDELRSASGRTQSQLSRQQQELTGATTTNNYQLAEENADLGVEGNRFVTTICTIAAQSSQSRIVVALLKDGERLILKIQEMRPGIFEVGTSHQECLKFFEEHRKLMHNLNKQRQAPIEGWMAKYQKIASIDPNMSTELKLIYMCMAENLQGCWRALLAQLEQRLHLLDGTCKFYESVERLVMALDKADNHVQIYRQEFLDGPGSIKFNQASNELKRLNQEVMSEYLNARREQQQVIQLIGRVATGNLGDARANYLISDGQNLINYIRSYLDPLERRKIQLENVITTTKSSTNLIEKHTRRFISQNAQETSRFANQSSYSATNHGYGPSSKPMGPIREITSFNDLNLVENWLNVKINQLNSSLLSSLGSGVPDSRSILSKHEQVALECSAIEDATLTFNGKNIHALKSMDQPTRDGKPSLFERQKMLATKVRDVITILDARIVLLRRTIDFYIRAKDATADIGKMMRRLQVDNSLQSVQYVANELELKDVSSVVASGATVISELQQLQLAQQHGQRSKIVNLNLITNGIRSVIDQLNQDLAHLKTVLNQRKLVLLNEDSSKMANNFSNKCHQLQSWLNSQAKSFLMANNRLGTDANQVREFQEEHEQLRLAVQNKTLEVEALLRSLPTLTESFDAKSQIADEIQRDTDELRQDWIRITNCLDRRIEFSKRYLAILNMVAILNKELNSLDGSAASGSELNGGRPKTPEERTDEDIKANIDQSIGQLTNQVKNFEIDAQKSDTSLVYANAPDAEPDVNDLNKQQLIDHANGLMQMFKRRKTSVYDSNSPASANVAGRKQSFRQRENIVDRPTVSSSLSSSTTTTTTTSTTTTAAKAPVESTVRVAPPPQPGRPNHMRPSLFVKHLCDQEVEPFKTVELVCETQPGLSCKIDWLMNNYKKIPANIKHSISSDENRHKLFIGHFNPMCCGTYIARAIDQENGQIATSSCKLRLSGIKEAHDDPQQKQQPQTTTTTTNTTRMVSNKTNEKAMERIIQGVGSPMDGQPMFNEKSLFPITQTSYNGLATTTNITTRIDTNINRDSSSSNSNLLQVTGNRTNRDESPAVSSTTISRSVSKSPFEGTPQPPTFTSDLITSRSPGGSRAGLVCVVIGNPPPTIEWIHNNKSIATTRCPRSTRGNICKLTIETLNDNTQGQYVCRASNRLGQSTSTLTVAK